MKNAVIAVSAACLLASCASRASDIPAAYVSTVGYQNLTCEQLANEAQAISARAIAASDAQNRKAGQDAAAMAVGMVIFWPALFLTQGDGAQAAEVARLKGEMDAIENVSTLKNCGIQFATSPSV